MPHVHVPLALGDLKDEALRHLFEYWQARKNGKIAPARQDIDPTDLPDVLARIYLVEGVGEPPRFRVRLAGTEVVRRFGREVTGKYVDELDLDDLKGEILGDYAEAVRHCRPVCTHLEFSRSDRLVMVYERLILPLSADGRTVDMLLCALSDHSASSRESRPR